MSLFITLGIILLLLAVLFALPFFGVGMVIPLLGDVVDIPISFFFAIVGVVFLLIGGVLDFVIDYWWLLLFGLLVYVGLVSWKGWRGHHPRRKR